MNIYRLSFMFKLIFKKFKLILLISRDTFVFFFYNLIFLWTLQPFPEFNSFPGDVSLSVAFFFFFFLISLPLLLHWRQEHLLLVIVWWSCHPNNFIVASRGSYICLFNIVNQQLRQIVSIRTYKAPFILSISWPTILSLFYSR